MSEFGKGIPLASGFDLGAKKPLDSRDVVDTIEERNAHVTENRVYEGMTVYVKEDKKVYRYDGNEWIDCTNVNLSDYYTSNEVDELFESLDIEDCSYVGNEIPEDDKIWFSDGVKTAGDGVTYDNPLIQELFACINILQQQIKELQDEVAYLKIHGGGNGSDVPTSGDYLVLEDGSILLLEDGSNFLLENSAKVDNCILLENGFELLLEDGSSFLLESA